MKKPWLVVLILIIAGLLWMWNPRRDAAAPRTPVGAEPAAAAPQRAAALVAKSEPASSVQPSAAVSPPADRAVAPTDEPPTTAEQELLVMYDEMVTAFEQHPTSCRELGIAIETLIASHKAAIERFRDERAQLTAEQWTAAQERLERTQGERMERMRHVIEQSVARCKTNDRLRGALRDLAKASSPPS